MPEPNEAADGQSKGAAGAAEALKLVAGLGGVAYAIGFVAVNASLSDLGIYSFSLFQGRYLTAGLLYVLLTIVSGIGWIAALLAMRKQSPIDQWEGFWLGGRLLAGCLLGVLFALAIYWAIWKFLFGESLPDLWGPFLLWVVCNTAALLLLSAFGARRFQTNRSGGLFWLMMGMLLFAFSVHLYGTEAYTLIPGRWGGGKPQKVQLLVDRAGAGMLADCGLSVRTSYGGNPVGEDAWFLTDELALFESGKDAHVLSVPCRGRMRALVVKSDHVEAILYSN